MTLDATQNVASAPLMKVANVAALRNDFRKVAAWIKDGESVHITMRGKLFATLSPAARQSAPPIPKIDFAKQLQEIWGATVFTERQIQQMREAELEGQQG